jgi:hypothetical protein
LYHGLISIEATGIDNLYFQIKENEVQMMDALDQEKDIDESTVDRWRASLKPLISDAINNVQPTNPRLRSVKRRPPVLTREKEEKKKKVILCVVM